MRGTSIRTAFSFGFKVAYKPGLIAPSFSQHAGFSGGKHSTLSRRILQPFPTSGYATSVSQSIRSFSSQEISKNLRLLTPENEKLKVDCKSLKVEVKQERPLVVILEWMLAQRKHVAKFTDLYLSSGYDVLTAPMTPKQLLFPTSGSQLIAVDLLKFLAANPAYTQIVVHGFSVGGYLWGETRLLMDRYPSIPERIVGQVWDSLVDVVGATRGVATSMFPKNSFLRNIVEKCIQFHLWMFQNVATKHYHASSDCFHNTPVRAPILLFASRSDPICSFKEILDVSGSWRKLNINVTTKIWEESPHVGHLRIHRAEYISELNNFLGSVNLPLVHDSDSKKLVSKL